MIIRRQHKLVFSEPGLNLERVLVYLFVASPAIVSRKE
jgi:hypothetical protein